jgi:magnesium transporter
MLCLILHSLNEQASKVISSIGSAVEEASDTISEITRSLNIGANTMGTVHINETIIELNKMEELVSRCLESQLSLARAARYLDAEVPPHDDLQIYIRALREDIGGVKEHAAFEHDSVRYLQNAILAAVNVKQNQIVRVFTIITVVFLPPTLIASIYGMNFAVMPELGWALGFPVSILLMLAAALLPMLYIKYRGWLR